MKAYPYIGAYSPDAGFSLARTVGNMTVVDQRVCDDPIRWAALRASGLQVILNLGHFSEELLRDPTHAPDWPDICRIQQRCARDGVQPLALLITDEPYGHLHHGLFHHWPSLRGVPRITPSIVDAFAEGLSTYARALRGLFGCWVGAVDTVWQRDQKPGWRYQPVPAGFDFIAVDAYLTGTWSDRYAAEFLPTIYREAWRAGGKPILAVPQAFRLTRERDILYPDWAHQPTVEQMRQQIEILDHCQGVAGVAWFCLDFLYGQSDVDAAGLAQSPDRLAAAQAYWQHVRDRL